MLQEITQRIDRTLKRPGFNKSMLAELSGVHRNTLENYDQPGWNPNLKSLDRVMKVIDVLEGLPPK